MNIEIAALLKKIEVLEKENALLLAKQENKITGDAVLVPENMKPLFALAQETVGNYFTKIKMEPHEGTIEINNQRYVLIRASALSKDFLDSIQSLYADRGEAEAMAIGKNLLFDIAHTLGINDAKNFHARMHLTDPIAKLSAGPVHFAFTGWAFVEILPESNPSPDDNFYLVYNHPFSFEADSWVRSGKKSDTTVCIMSAGYSSGWCEESFGIPLTAVEVSCIAKGDDKCTFIMSPPHKIEEHLNRFNKKTNKKISTKGKYDIPTFFERKKVEEEMQRSKMLAENLVKTKEDFISNMSHELRTPLGAVLGFTDLLYKTELNPTQKDFLEAIKSSGTNLLAIINNILDLSKIDAGKFNINKRPFNLAELMQSVQTMFVTQARNKQLDFSVTVIPEINYFIIADALLLTQIFINLVGNAIKFTSAGKVAVYCTEKNKTDNSVEIFFTVKDTGIGIPQDKLEQVFERFTQADSNITREYGGTGLGLAITRQLVELLGGDIKVNSAVGMGTEFYFSLIFETANLETPHLSQKIKTDSKLPNKNLQILVVEDNLLNQKLTTTILSNNEIEYIVAANGEEALEKIKTLNPHVILMDIQMPVMDGCEATGIMRKELQIKTPIIAMTAHALPGESERCRQQGFNDYLAKPFTEEQLLQKIIFWTAEPDKMNIEKLTDLSFLQKQTKNNGKIIKEMMQTFIAQIPEDLAALDAAINSGNFKAIYKITHSLKNTVPLFGLQKHTSTLLNKMENLACAEAEIGTLGKIFVKIKAYCEQAVQELKQEITNS